MGHEPQSPRWKWNGILNIKSLFIITVVISLQNYLPSYTEQLMKSQVPYINRVMERVLALIANNGSGHIIQWLWVTFEGLWFSRSPMQWYS